METGQTAISFASIAQASSNLKNGFIKSELSQQPFACELGFVTENIDEVVALALKNGATILEQPTEKPWGQTVAYLRDLDGFLLEICTPMT